MNYLMAFAALLIYGLFYRAGSGLGTWFYYLAVINVGLGTFNLIPFPPLDGSNILMECVPKIRKFYGKIRPYAMPILLVCLAVGILRIPLAEVNSAVIGGMWKAVKKILRIGVFPPGSGSWL